MKMIADQSDLTIFYNYLYKGVFWEKREKGIRRRLKG